MDFRRWLFLITVVNKKWPPRLIQALTEAVEMPARLRDTLPNAAQKNLCSSVG